MAAGTGLSRVLGFVRLIMLVFLFGNATRQADMFAIANTVPNSMYILLAGGLLNSVLVPQLVRAVRNDRDGGEAYTQRIMTAGLLGLGAVTVLLTLAVPLIVRLYSGADWKSPGLREQYASMTMLAYYCMPQVFFYGVHVLAGQVLNARDRFGPMMWAPIANNVVSIAVLGLFLGVFGRTDTGQAFTSSQELLLGLGSTVGIVVQAAVLVPFLRSAGFRFAPRFDFRHTGLGHTFSLARWTIGYVVVTQLALVVSNRLATGATAGGTGAGLAAYNNAYAIWILPHSLVTISLATAMLPSTSRLAARGDLAGVAAETTRTVRLATTVLLPAAVGFAVLGLPITQLAFGFGRGDRDAAFVGWTLIALALGLVPFTIQYVFLRAFYALEDTRSTFFLQILISGVNVLVAVALVFTVGQPRWVAPSLGVAYSLSYAVGIVVSYRRLRRRLTSLSSHELVRHCARLLLASLPAAAGGWVVCWVVSGCPVRGRHSPPRWSSPAPLPWPFSSSPPGCWASKRSAGSSPFSADAGSDRRRSTPPRGRTPQSNFPLSNSPLNRSPQGRSPRGRSPQGGPPRGSSLRRAETPSPSRTRATNPPPPAIWTPSSAPLLLAWPHHSPPPPPAECRPPSTRGRRPVRLRTQRP